MVNATDLNILNLRMRQPAHEYLDFFRATTSLEEIVFQEVCLKMKAFTKENNI